MRSFLIASILVGLIAAVSCKKDEKDTTPPQIMLVEPEDHDVFKIDSLGSVEIHFNATFTDNEELGSYKIDIHSAEGHSHKSMRLTTAFDTLITGTLSGKQYIVHQHIHIPHFPVADTGHYHVLVFCLDKAGNQATTYRTVEIIK